MSQALTARKPATCTIGLLWHSLKHPNLGIDALTRAHISILSAAAARVGVLPHFILLGVWFESKAEPDLPNVEPGAFLKLRDVAKFRSGFAKALMRCDVVLDISEGDSFADIYGRERFMFQTGTKMAAALVFRKPLVLAPQTIGPFNQPWAARAARLAMRMCKRVYARDAMSSAVLKTMGITGNVDEAIDVAFRLPFTRPAPRPPGSPIRVGFNVSGLLFHGGYTGNNELGMVLDYAALTRRLIADLSKRPGVEIWLVPHVLGSGGRDDDNSAIATIQAEFPSVHASPQFETSIEAKSFIAGLDLLVAGRMHACIAAFSAGVPVVPIAYSRKFNGLFGTLGYNWFVDGRATGTDAAEAFVLQAFDKRDTMKADIAKGLPLALDRLSAYEDYLTTFLRDAMGRRAAA